MSREKKRAVFFDRDGVLNVDHGYTYRCEDFEWIPGAKESIKMLNDLGWLVVVITNQSGIGRGYYREADVKALHVYMNGELAVNGAQIDAFYYCPHHPEAAVDEYRKTCDCRKPRAGMIRAAMQDWAIDPAKSFVVGDKESDMQAAAAAGLTGHHFTGGNLHAFVKTIVSQLTEEERNA